MQMAAICNSTGMTAVFHARSCGCFIGIKGNVLLNKLRRMNQGSRFLESSFGNRDNLRIRIQFRKTSPKCIKNGFTSRTDPSIFTSIALEL